MPVVFTSTLNQAEKVDPETEAEPAESRPEGGGGWVYGISQTPQVWLDHQVSETLGALSYKWDAVEELFPAGVLDDMLAAYQGLIGAAGGRGGGLARAGARPAPGEPAPPARRVQRHRGTGAGGAPARALPGPGGAAPGRPRRDHVGEAADLRPARPRLARPRPPPAAPGGAAEPARRRSSWRRGGSRWWRPSPSCAPAAPTCRSTPTSRPSAWATCWSAARSPSPSPRRPSPPPSRVARRRGEDRGGRLRLRGRAPGAAAGGAGAGGPGLRHLHLRLHRPAQGGDDRPPGRPQHLRGRQPDLRDRPGRPGARPVVSSASTSRSTTSSACSRPAAPW